MKGIMQNIINIGKNGRLLGLLLLAAAGISAGCSTRAESRQAAEPTIAKKEAVTATPTPAIKTSTMPATERRFDGDFEGDMDYSTPSTAKRTAPVNLNKATFEKIRIGMALEEVEKLVGEKGMLVGTNIVNGKTKKIYKWSNDNFSSYIDVTIENGKVIEKNDKNLK
jgi:hypothetical protein